MPQNAGAGQGGVNKSRDKSSDSKRKSQSHERRDTEARPLDPGTRTDGGAPSQFKGGRREPR
jgi:hypothetical protein